MGEEKIREAKKHFFNLLSALMRKNKCHISFASHKSLEKENKKENEKRKDEKKKRRKKRKKLLLKIQK